ncbi:PEPTIDE DEFORMYLASE [Salix koriyanagi]|uniref:Peptide deformylase n=1 Tax=Salix koriyanagi TaxID=2511006 RepID=A0A9Q0Q6L2_9ROSI|nr:PEPTIDE DEFORMYLASE [Salix koriyanagi]
MSVVVLAFGVRHSSPYRMGSLHRFSLRLLPISLPEKCSKPTTRLPISRFTRLFVPKSEFMNPYPHFTTRKSLSSSSIAKAGWFLGKGQKKKTILPDIVKAGDPVLHEPAREVDPKEIGSGRIQKIIDDMVKAMRMAPGVGLAAPQIGIPLRIIVLEDTAEYIGYAPKDETKAQDRRPFDLLVRLLVWLRENITINILIFSIQEFSLYFYNLLVNLRQVIVNPKLKKKSNRTAFFFERGV